MSDHNDYSKQYSAADIQRYLKGEMSAEEMHAIETAALDDPFLADAIEGFEAMIGRGNEEAAELELRRLNKKFNERVRQPAKVVSITHSRWWQISAAAVIFIIIGFALYNNRMKEEAQSKLAVTQKQPADSSALAEAEKDRASISSALSDTQNKQEKKTAASRPAPTDSHKRPALIDDNTSNEAYRQSQKPATAVAEKAIDKNEDVGRLRTFDQEKEKERSEKPAIVDHVPAKREIADESTVGTEALARRTKQLAGQLNNFSGRVVDTANKPLVNASVQVLQNKTNVLTDETGKFSFATKDSVVDVQVGLLGFEPRNFRLQNDAITNNLVLEPSNRNMNEVVVTAYGSKRKKDASKVTAKVQNAVPEIGWIEYEKYLEQNKKPPAGNPLMKGEVVVSFEVKKGGVLSDLKIEKSLSQDYDKEAIRLVREGPSWKLLNGRKTRITVIVKF